MSGSKRRGPAGWANFTTVFYHYQRGAKKRGYVFQLTRKFFWKESQRPCFYCGAKPSNVEDAPGKFGAYRYNGFDRVDNTKGYLRSNVVTCCRRCNRAKWQMTAEDFYKLANCIARRHPVTT